MKNKVILFVLLAGMFGNTAICQDISPDFYKASTIPEQLKENANSVIRYSDIAITVKGPDKKMLKQHTIVTILNEKGNREAIMLMGYNKKYDNYSNIEMRVYNEDGVVVKKYHKYDMYDGSAADYETMATNERFLALKHAIASYPVTIETEFEEDESSFIDLGSWAIQNDVSQSVQNSTYKVSVLPSLGFRYKNEHTTVAPLKVTTKEFDTYIWHVNDLKAIKKEEHVLPWTVLPDVLFAVNSFSCYGYPGDFSSWQSFGKWIQSLNSDVNMLSPDRIAEVKKMTDSIKTDKGKAKFLYNYMQKNMRYVSIQLGIGGFKPFAATFVDEKKYGDCKALSNYMWALLKAVNIDANYAIIRAGNNAKPADFDFPNSPFNHAILCIPFKNDTTWLECTSSTQPFGKLGPFTENRNALLITPEGGKLVNTPRSTMDDNQFNSEAHIVLNADGSAKAQIKILSTGNYRFNFIGYSSLKLDDQKEYIMRSLNIKQPSVFDISSPSDNNGIREVKIDLEYDKFCDIATGNKQFYRPRVFDLWAITIPAEEQRKSDYYFDSPMEKTCVTTIELPAGFEVETLPANQNFKFTYGNYDISYVYDAGKNRVISITKCNLINQLIPAGKYTEMQEYVDNIAKAQNKKLVIRKKA